MLTRRVSQRLQRGEATKIGLALEEVSKTNTLLSSLPLSKSIAPTLNTVVESSHTRAEDLENATRSLQSSLTRIKDAFKSSPSYNPVKVNNVIKLIDKSQVVSDKLTACAAPGVDNCDGLRRSTRTFGLSASAAVTNLTNEVDAPSDAYLKVSEDVKEKLKDLNHLLNRKTPAEMTDVCEAFKTSVDMFKRLKGAGPLANEPLAMTILACDCAKVCPI
ncbi:hypothetical protein BGZ95_001841 [Linnemannia exigua]|uniref:Uncharacterized protein n=1 Tax=Linnemannia exigua TaxID=604196 RepID=A0AAD4DKE4_9FUNG|nr:hypothetical protein BGZ95_001841 [Linnemannia exigua]